MVLQQAEVEEISTFCHKFGIDAAGNICLINLSEGKFLNRYRQVFETLLIFNGRTDNEHF